MKKSPQNFVPSLVLVIVLFLTSACQTGNDDPVPTETSSTPTQQSTAPISEQTPESEVAVAAQEGSQETTPTAEAAEAVEVTATRPPQPTEAPELIDSEPPTATAEAAEATEATEAPQATKTAEPTVDPNITPTITPLVRTDWRAASGDFILRFENGIKIFDYYIIITEEWWEVFEIRQDSETKVSFWYTGKPSEKEEVFSISAYRSDEWEERKSNGDQANEIFGLRNAIFVYEMVEGNPFSGEHAEKFDELKGTVPEIIAETFEIETRKSTN